MRIMKGEKSSIYFDPKHYDAMFTMTDDIPFYLDCVSDYDQPVLELACGTGRVTVPMAERKVEWKIRILFPKEIDALLKYNGFQIENKYGDFDRTEFTGDSEKQVIICKKV